VIVIAYRDAEDEEAVEMYNKYDSEEAPTATNPSRRLNCIQIKTG
jgi:hypothetical protein